MKQFEREYNAIYRTTVRLRIVVANPLSLIEEYKRAVAETDHSWSLTEAAQRELPSQVWLLVWSRKFPQKKMHSFRNGFPAYTLMSSPLLSVIGV